MFNCMSLSFDAGNMTSLLPLYCGAALHFGEPGEGVIGAAIACGASHMILPTALLANLLPPADLGSLKAIGFGGEACPSETIRSTRTPAPRARTLRISSGGAVVGRSAKRFPGVMRRG